MANESLNNNEKLPGILILFCISTVLGFLYNLDSVLTMNNQFQWFYACYLIFPIIELFGIYKHSNKILLCGFYGTVLFRMIEYSYAGYAYGFDNLFSTFGTNIAGYLTSIAIWWSYFYFSKKSAVYFRVDRTTSLKGFFPRPVSSTPSSTLISKSAISTAPTDSKNLSDALTSSASLPASASVRPNHHFKIVIFILLLTSAVFIALNLYQYSLYQSSLSKIQSLSTENQSLSDENKKLQEDITALESENDSLQAAQSDLYVNSMQFYYLTNQIRFILDDGTKVYHTYDCPIYQNYSGSFWIHNPEYCEYLGYSPCSVCS